MIRITLRLPDDVHVRLAAQAEVDRRSLNSEIVHLLEVALTDVEAGEGEPLHGE
ncbi:Arc family DNA-binding protein [Streptomyces sp. NPDC057027]|uniref:Arc family DNA-binding protein n=1 Tax=Streptomyces sp. NPDC057027 TaxID=3346004 RepID=UPI00362CF230